jgi:hypothetical protein
METAPSLNGSARWLFMARPVKELGPGGQRCAERARGWNRGPLRKGTHEVQSGCTCLDAFSARGRTRAAAHLPHLLLAIQAIVDSQSQAAPQLRTTRLYTRLRAAEVRRQRIARQGSRQEEWPTVQTLTTTLNSLGYLPQKVTQSQPQKTALTPRRSLPRCTRASRPPIAPRTCDASPSMPRRRLSAGLFPVAARVAWRWPQPSTTLPPRRPCPP